MKQWNKMSKLERQYHYSVSGFGKRLFSFFSGCPKLFLSYFKMFKDGKFVEVDIKACQLLLLAYDSYKYDNKGSLNDDCTFINEYVSLYNNADDPYEDLALIFGNIELARLRRKRDKLLDDGGNFEEIQVLNRQIKIQRNITKPTVLKSLYEDSGYENKKWKISKSQKIFKNKMPIFADYVWKMKTTFNPEIAEIKGKNYKKFSNLCYKMQIHETNIFREVWKVLLERNIPFVCRHDSVVVPPEYTAEVAKVVMDTFKEYTEGLVKIQLNIEPKQKKKQMDGIETIYTPPSFETELLAS